MTHWRGALIFLVWAIAGCTPRGTIALDPTAAEVGQQRAVFYSTTRSASDDPGLVYGTARTARASFGRFDMSIPPDRQAGDVSYPQNTPDPSTDFVATEAVVYDDRTSFRRALARDLRNQPRGERDVVLFVHGFNSTFAEGMIRLAQLAEDLSLPGVAVHYAWPSLNNPLGYSYDRDSVLFGRDGLEALLEETRAAGAEDIILVGHSLGSLMLMETLRQIEIGRPGAASRTVEGVILMSPDIDVDLFRMQARRIGDLPQPFLIFTSQRDRALQLSARLTGQRERLGNLSDLERVADLEVTMLDVSNFRDGTRHLTPATSPTLIALMQDLGSLNAAFQGEQAGRPGLLPGTVLTVQNATQIILSPVTALSP
ncbi:alpha/beta hydrolase [Salibaculum griseiflavum]|uniref:Esterase/lipase superfamily enzyme n=1 Tax=Salibaculum griseiflavum TaxID=1914409 RepID=A0A2V1P3R2_9RHOB|nr:alpha/beta fold hydrolase [Salibaculum griseiflavum]PWG17075.1 hypothetical protein DFK10_08500 [Salibaculum griseiflavum]